MPQQIIRAARALTPMQEIAGAAVVVEDGRIAAAGRRDEVTAAAGAREREFAECTLVPGFVDIHIHGAGARDTMEATPEALETICRTVARHGTTAIIATTVSASLDATCRSLEGIAKYIASPNNRFASSGAEIAGIHLEGPFISQAQRGVHPAEWLARPTVAAFERMLEAARGAVRILTIAPELEGATEVIDRAVARGITIGLGHTDATYSQTHSAIEHGARHAVHVFNAMRPFAHRETGVLGAVLTDPRMTAEIIADGAHVDDAAIRLLLAAKGSERTILVSDGTAATGMPDGVYSLGPFEFTVQGGICRNAEGKLAGSTLTLDRAVRHMARVGATLADAIRMATLNPAERVGLASRKGSIAPGKDADLVVLKPNGEIAAVMARGQWLE